RDVVVLRPCEKKRRKLFRDCRWLAERCAIEQRHEVGARLYIAIEGGTARDHRTCGKSEEADPIWCDAKFDRTFAHHFDRTNAIGDAEPTDFVHIHACRDTFPALLHDSILEHECCNAS